MEYLILGLLILSPMTGYELQQFIKKNLALICSHSAGSVQTALAKLEKEEKVTATETVQGKRRKKQFSITDTGRAAFSHWVAPVSYTHLHFIAIEGSTCLNRGI